MPEDLDINLNWPKEGLIGVPASDATNGSHIGRDVLEQGIGHITRSVDDLLSNTLTMRTLIRNRVALETARAANPEDLDDWNEQAVTKATTSLGRAELSLSRLERAATDLSAKLKLVDEMLGERLDTMSLDGISGATDTQVGLATAASGTSEDQRSRRTTAVTWPPLLPPKKPSRLAFLGRPAVVIPLFLIAALVIAGVAYKVIHDSHAKNTPAAASTSGGTLHGLKVLPGASCVAGTSTVTIQLASAVGNDGTYTLGADGTVSNAASTGLTGVVVHWDVIYKDGFLAKEATTVSGGATLAGKSTTSWEMDLPRSEGSVPPVSAAVTSVTASPAQPACA
jgi:hypothetical protein